MPSPIQKIPGQRKIVQIAHVVNDIEKTMDRYYRVLGIGPWDVYLFAPPMLRDSRYRGKPARLSYRLAQAWVGDLQFELIQPLDNAPSVYWETIKKRGYGFHHWGVSTTQFDADHARYRAAGYEEGFFARVPSGGRVAYMDTTRDMPGMVELIEMGASFDPIFGRFYAASIAWDGKDPIRPFM